MDEQTNIRLEKKIIDIFNGNKNKAATLREVMKFLQKDYAPSPN